MKIRHAAFAPLLLVLTALLPSPTRAQSVLEAIETLGRENAELYADPLVTGLGIGLNVGFSQTATVHDVLGFDIGVRVVGARVPDEANTFLARLPGQITVDHPLFPGQQRTFTDPYAPAGGSLVTPTVAGQGTGIVLQPSGAFRDSLQAWAQSPDNYNVPFPEGFDIPLVPFAVIQASLGVPLGTEVTLRVIPAYDVNDEVGEVEALGFGIKHSVSQWLPMMPVDLAVSVGWQDLSVGDYLDASGTNYGVIASREWGNVTLYGAGSLAESEVDVSYTLEASEINQQVPIRFTKKLDSEAQLSLGVRFRFAIVDLSAEYTLAEYDALSAKVGLSFR